jgi:hypothetical protein
MTATSNQAAQGIVLTVGHVGQWKGDLRRNREEISRLSDENKVIEAKLAAAALFLDVDAVPEAIEADAQVRPDASAELPPASKPEPEASQPPRRARRRKASGEPTWADIVMEGVQPAPLGLTYAEMRNFAASSDLGSRLAQSDKGYHNAISRLAKDELIVRDHGRVFTPEAYQRFLKAVEAGEASTTVPQPMAYSPMGEAILQIVAAHPGELNGKGVISELRKDSEHNATLTPHETGAYNIIARLVRRGQIVRRDDGLISPGKNFPKDLGDTAHNDTGTPNGIAVGVPEAGGAATPPNDGQPTLRLIG